MGIAGVADAHYLSILDPDVRFDDTDQRVHDDHVGDDRVERTLAVCQARYLSHAVAHRLAPAVDLLIAWKQQAAFDLTDELGVGQPEPVARGRTVQVGVLLAWNVCHSFRSSWRRSCVWRLRTLSS